MPHPEQTSTPASSPDGGVATTAWPTPAPQPAGQKAAAPASKPISAADFLAVGHHLREDAHQHRKTKITQVREASGVYVSPYDKDRKASNAMNKRPPGAGMAAKRAAVKARNVKRHRANCRRAAS